jgi:hypothetical protein
MSRTIGIAHDVARRVELGQSCASCDEPFVKAHGFPVACEYCWPKLSLEERTTIRRATEPEATANHFRTEARKRRKANQENNENG